MAEAILGHKTQIGLTNAGSELVKLSNLSEGEPDWQVVELGEGGPGR